MNKQKPADGNQRVPHEQEERDSDGLLPGSPAGFDIQSTIRDPQVRGDTEHERRREHGDDAHHTRQGAGPNQGARES